MSKMPGIKNIDARDEGAALTMAEGWARATGKIGICSVTHGPGITRMMTSLVSVTRCQIPVVICTSATELNNDLINQAIDQRRLVTATGAGYVEVLKPGYAESAVRLAFHMARTELRPVVLAVPMDVQKMECDADGADYEPSTTLYNGQQKIRPALDRLQAAVDIIRASKKCVVIAGRGAIKSGALDAAAKLAKRLGALTATTLVAKGSFGHGDDSEFHAGIAGMFSTRTVMQLFEEADCAIAIGASLNPHTIEGGYLFPQGKIIHIDAELGVVMGNGRVADCYIQGDAAVTVQMIDDLLAQANFSQAGYRTAAVKKLLAGADRDPAEYEIEAGTVDPREACRIVDEHLPVEVGVAIGVGHRAFRELKAVGDEDRRRGLSGRETGDEIVEGVGGLGAGYEREEEHRKEHDQRGWTNGRERNHRRRLRRGGRCVEAGAGSLGGCAAAVYGTGAERRGAVRIPCGSPVA